MGRGRGQFVLPAFVLWLLGCLAMCHAAPTVTEDGTRWTVANEHLKVVIDSAHGGAVAEIRRADGRLICANHSLYTDRGIYGSGVYVGVGDVPAKVAVREVDGSVFVRSEGTLAGRGNELAGGPGAIEYWLETRVGDGAQLQVAWGITPRFDCDTGGFLAYILSINDILGLSVNTDEGVLLQDRSRESARTYQSAATPLNRQAPWLGFMYSDGSVVGFSGLHSTVPFANIFCHESGNGGAAMFFAWMDGGRGADLQAGVEWRAGYTISMHDSFEGFREAVRGVTVSLGNQ